MGWRRSECGTTLVESAESESTAGMGLGMEGRMSGWLTTQTRCWMVDHCCGLSGSEAIVRSVVGWMWLSVHLNCVQTPPTFRPRPKGRVEQLYQAPRVCPWESIHGYGPH